MIEFIIETVDSNEHGSSLYRTLDVAINNLLEIVWRLGELGSENPSIRIIDWQTTKVSFQTNEGAVAFKLICDRKILHEDHL
jgi:hypothetical protein